MAGGVIVLTDEVGGTTKERVGTGGDDDTLSLTLLTGRATMGARNWLARDIIKAPRERTYEKH